MGLGVSWELGLGVSWELGLGVSWELGLGVGWELGVAKLRSSRCGAKRYSGMLPCFFGGFLSRLVSRPARAAISFARVWRGWMTSSMNPRAAAT